MSFCRYCSLNFNIYFYWFPVWCNIVSLCRMPVKVLKIFAYQTCTLVEVLAFSTHWFFFLPCFTVYSNKWPERSLENLNLPLCLNPFQYSCLEYPTDRGAWETTVHAVANSQTRLSNFTFTSSLLNHWANSKWGCPLAKAALNHIFK